MNSNRNIVHLSGCRPTPLAFYLKGLGIVRILSEQIDPDIRCRWIDESLQIRTTLSKQQIIDFIMNEYAPTPVTTPWNGGSGYFPKDKGAREKGIEPILSSSENRFEPYRSAIKMGIHALEVLKIPEKPEGDEKLHLIKYLRTICSEKYLEWLDTALILANEKAKYPPILGTGGIDGRLDFTSTFMQRVVSLFNLNNSKKKLNSENLLNASIFDDLSTDMQKAPIGQYHPSAVGGFNSSPGYTGDGASNPWDFIFLIEGTMVSTASCHKKLLSGQPGVMAAPFTVKPSASGYGSSAMNDSISGRAELWMPVWEKWISLNEIKHFFAEGRCEIGRRKASTGIDFARAISSLGISRGINSFYRYGIHERNGLAYLATPLGKWTATQNKSIDLIDEIDIWLDRYKRAAADANAPGRISSSYERLENTIMEFARYDNRQNQLKLARGLTQAEQALATSIKFTESKYLRPVPMLSQRWLKLIDDGSPEYTIAIALGALNSPSHPLLREYLEPVKFTGKYGSWTPDGKSSTHVYRTNDPIQGLMNIAITRFRNASKNNSFPLPVSSHRPTSLSAVESFLSGHFDPIKLDLFLRFTSLIRFSKNSKTTTSSNNSITAAYTVLKLCHLPFSLKDHTVKHDARICQLLKTGNLNQAVKLASRRLKVSGLPPKITTASALTHESSVLAHRYLISLLIDVQPDDLKKLVRRDITPGNQQDFRIVSFNYSRKEKDND